MTYCLSHAANTMPADALGPSGANQKPYIIDSAAGLKLVHSNNGVMTTLSLNMIRRNN